ncbi:MAG TPA: ABC transporter permease [Solirubrobacteraceae bacterium]|jgi:ABC-2 type transport system permease protein|nr:ABC transporter permease [Solirubrobacteraceae bacterium]
MTTVDSPTELPGAERAGLGVLDAYVTELQKLRAQLTTRLLAVFAVLGPFAFAVLLKVQSGTPSDALFGAWVHTSGFAVSLVVLGFAGSWGFPIVVGALAGDLFSSEDRYGTWKTILTRSCSREDVFVGKVLAAGTVAALITLLLAVASLVAGGVLVGLQPVVNLSGELTSGGRLLILTLVSWAYCLLPALAYMSVAILVSVATRNGILGVLAPLILALVTQLLDLIGRGVIVHMLLIGSGFDGWHGLFVSHPFLGPMAVSTLVCVAWIAACLGASWRLLRRRDFVSATSGPGWTVPLRIVAVAVAVIGALALCAGLGPGSVTANRVAASVGATFDNATLLQQALIGRYAPPSAQLRVEPNCNKRGAADAGPGDWLCNVYVYLPQPRSVPFQQSNVEYDVSVQYNGCWKASSPPAFVGGQTMQNTAGREVTNPLFVVYGCFNVL